jgi:hypothetical protein
MGRDWITDSFPKIPDEQLKFVHDYLDTKGKNVVRGPARIPGPDGRVIDVLADQEVRFCWSWCCLGLLDSIDPFSFQFGSRL